MACGGERAARLRAAAGMWREQTVPGGRPGDAAVRGMRRGDMLVGVQHTPLQVYGYLLEKAVQYGQLEVMRMLLPRARQSERSDLLHSIAHLAAQHGHLEILKWAAEQMNDAFPFHVDGVRREAQIAGHIEILEWLRALEFEIDLGIIFRHNARKLAVVRWLVERGADLETKGGFGSTALQWACGSGHTHVAKYLLGSKGMPQLAIAQTTCWAA